jgi:hypothetical protein
MKAPKLPWTRLILCVSGIAVIQGSWRWAINHLYVMPEAALPVYQAITVHVLYTTAALIVLAITGKLIWDWKNASSSAADTATEIVRSKLEQRHEQVWKEELERGD